jgi:ABC-2 type transport system permease protein
MKKYLTIAKAEWLDAIQSYQEVFLWILIESIPIFVMGTLWLSAGRMLPAAQISYLVTYYVLVLVISRLTGFYFEQSMQDEIREGTFSRYLTKPVSMQKYFIFDNLGGKIFNTFFLLIPLLIIFVSIFHGYLVTPTLLNFVLFIASLLLVYFIQFFICLIVASCAFFLDQAFAINHLHWMLDAVTGGYMLPLTFYPLPLQTAFAFLPFAYVFYGPIRIFTGQLDPASALRQIVISAVWVIVLYFVSSFVWRQGIKRYSAVGG